MFILGQVGVGTTNPDASSVLDISATDKGVLVPRVSLIDVSNLTTPVTTPATGLLVWNTNATVTGGNGVGFYFFNGVQWMPIQQALSDDADFYEVGTTAAPDDISDDIYTQGYVGMGTNNPNYPLDILYTGGSFAGGVVNVTAFQNTGSVDGIDLTIYGQSEVTGFRSLIYNSNAGDNYSVYSILENSGGGTNYGTYSEIDGGPTQSTGYGTYNRITGSSFLGYGIYNEFDAYGSSLNFGLFNNFLEGDSYGTYNNFFNSGVGDQYASYSNMNISANGDHYGQYIDFSGLGDGNKYGSYIDFSGLGDGNKYGSFVEFNNTGASYNYGNYNILSGTSAGSQIGVNNIISNVTSGGEHIGVNNLLNGEGYFQYGIKNTLSGTSEGTKYGIYNYIYVTGGDDKYGSYNNIVSLSGGTHYGVYSEVLKSSSFAGYFLGDVSIGTNTANNYILPPTRGTDGQIMQTDATGNVTWEDNVNPVSTIPIYTQHDATGYVLNTTTSMDLGLMDSALEPSLYNTTGNVQIKMVVRYVNNSAGTTNLQLRAHDGITETYPIVNTDAWTFSTTQNGGVATSPWKNWNAGTNAQEIHLNAWVDNMSVTILNVYLQVRSQ